MREGLGYICKARFRDFEAFAKWYVDNASTYRETVVEYFRNGSRSMSYDLRNTLSRLIGEQFGNNIGWEQDPKDIIKKIRKLNDYIMSSNFSFSLFLHDGDIAIIGYGKDSNTFIVPSSELEITPEKDYSNISLQQLRTAAIGGPEEKTGLVLSDNLPVSTIAEANELFADAEHDLNAVLDEMEDVKNAKTEELAKQQAEIDRMMQELNKKKEEMLAELEKQKAAMEAKKSEMERQLTMLDTQIYAIRCYMGETFELVVVRDGRPADIGTPIVLNQKLRYLDEELGKLASIYDVDYERYEIIEQLLAARDDVLVNFCPQPKCVTFIRVSRDNRTFYHGENNLLEEYENLHGKKIGLVVRNGERVFVGWTDEGRVYIDNDAFFKPGVTNMSEEKETDGYGSSRGRQEQGTSFGEVASRYFAFAILQGLLEYKKILEIPEKVTLMVPSRYVVHNYADAWLDDNRFGYLSDLNKKLSRRCMVGDKIIVIQGLHETDQKSYGGSRGHGDTNRTHDCNVESGLHNINFIDDDGQVFVSVLKKYSGGRPRPWYKGGGLTEPCTANFLIEDNEFINLTYMNSEWLKYYILTQKIGHVDTGGQEVNYAYLIRYLKIALKYVQEREAKEAAAISRYYNGLDKVRDWPVLLSHWKLINHVRAITDYQAKRFAKYLQEGRLLYVKHLFDEEYSGVKINLRDFVCTEVENTGIGFHGGCSDSEGEFSYNSPYGRQDFKLDSPEDVVAARTREDKRKMTVVLGLVQDTANELGWTIDDIVGAYEPKKLNNSKAGALIKETLNPDWSWKMSEELLDKAQEAEIGRYIDDDDAPKIVKYREIMFYNYLLAKVYPNVVRAMNYLERQKYDEEYAEVSAVG